MSTPDLGQTPDEVEEAFGDKINQSLIDAVETICSILKTHQDHVRPFEAAQVVRAFVPAINLATDLDPDFIREELVNLGSLTGDALGELLLAMPIMEPTSNELLDMHLAVDVANALGPDHAQNWYRFIVLVTKLA